MGYNFRYDKDLQLNTINDIDIGNLMEIEYVDCIHSMCDILNLIHEHYSELEQSDNQLIKKVKYFIEEASIQYIPEYLLEEL